VNLQPLPVNPIIGLTSRGEIGATFGYQWRDGSGTGPGERDTDGITDILFSTKWRLWQTGDENFKLSARFDLKLPTASEHRDLGTGDTDGDVLLIATRSWGNTSLDWNVGYTAVDLSRSASDADHWFLGQAVRQELNKRWTLIGEIYATLSQTDTEGSLNVHFNGGVQFSAYEDFIISALVGTASGDASPRPDELLGSYLAVLIPFATFACDASLALPD
jgi:hypothetical protein